MEIYARWQRILFARAGELRFRDPLSGRRSNLPGGGELGFCDPLGGSRSDLLGGGRLEL